MRIEDVTPRKFSCGAGLCPAVYKTSRGTYLVIGQKLTSEDSQGIISKKVGPNESVVEVPEGLLRDLFSNSD